MTAKLFQPQIPEGRQGSEVRTVLAAVAEIQAFVREILGHLPHELPEPNIEIVNRTGVTWLGRTVWNVGDPNTTIFLQKNVTSDSKTLKRILAHELLHHLEYLTKWLPLADQPNLNTLMRIEGKHGPFFHQWASKLNAIYGQDFISDASDSAMVEEEVRSFYVLLKRREDDGKIMLAYAVTPSQRQKDYINAVLSSGGVPRLQMAPGDYKLIRSRDRTLTLGGPIGRGFWSFNDPGMEKKLQDLWDNAVGIPKVASDDPFHEGGQAPDGEEDMAVIRKIYTQQQVLQKFRSMFPAWSVELQGTELVATSPDNMPSDYETSQLILGKLQPLSAHLGITVITQRRGGHLIISLDLRDLQP